MIDIESIQLCIVYVERLIDIDHFMLHQAHNFFMFPPELLC